MKQDDYKHDDDLAPLDDFEQEWVDRLNEPEPALKHSEDAFVQAVLERHQPAPTERAVAGWIGLAPRALATAAALLLAAAAGWYLYTTGNPSTETTDELAGNPDPTAEQQDSNVPAPQPDPGPAVAQADPTNIKLGQMIALTRTTVTQPANNLTDGLRQTPQALRVENLLELIDTPLPDLEELLTPLKPDNQQSRA